MRESLGISLMALSIVSNYHTCGCVHFFAKMSQKCFHLDPLASLTQLSQDDFSLTKRKNKNATDIGAALIF